MEAWIEEFNGHNEAEDIALETSPEFWRMIEERRRRPMRPLQQDKADLFPGE